MLTRKHFQSIADILNEFGNPAKWPDLQPIDPVVYEELVAAFGDFFLSQNPRFDRSKFQSACYRFNRDGSDYDPHRKLADDIIGAHYEITHGCSVPDWR